MPRPVSVIATVLNEAQAIDTLLASLFAQARLPDEVVIVDGGSRDGTLEQLHTRQQSSPVPLVVLSEPGCNIAQGRNAAIAKASGDIIAVTDAGVRLPNDWLQHLLAPFDAAAPPDVVSGFFAADPHSLFERVLGAVTLPRLEEIDPRSFMPSSRSVAFTRRAWQQAGGYPEWLDYCEDLVFDFTLQDLGCAFVFTPQALVWFRPRTGLRSFFKQYLRYSRGDGKANLYLWRHLLRYATYLAGLSAVLLAVFLHPLFLFIAALVLAAILGRSWRRLVPVLRGMTLREGITALFWLPVVVICGDTAKMLGYPAGVMWRLRYAPAKPWAKRAF